MMHCGPCHMCAISFDDMQLNSHLLDWCDYIGFVSYAMAVLLTAVSCLLALSIHDFLVKRQSLSGWQGTLQLPWTLGASMRPYDAGEQIDNIKNCNLM